MLTYRETKSWTKKEDWLEYIENSKHNQKLVSELSHLCRILKSIPRELEPSEKALLEAYENNH